MNIRYAEAADLPWIAAHDPHIAPEELKNLLTLRRLLLCEEGGAPVGWLRWNLFWDNTPFLNLIFLLPGFRRRGYGRAMLDFWTREMAAQGYSRLLTSTQSNEEAQHFYRALGYREAGVLLLPGEAAELVFLRELHPESA